MYETSVLHGTKGPSVAERATVQCHHSAKLQTEWVPTHSCSTHTAAEADNTGQRGHDRDPAGPERGAGNMDGVGERMAETRLYFCFCTGLFDSHLGLEEDMAVVWTTLIIYDHHSFISVLVMCVFVFLLQKLLDQILQRSNN